MSKLLIVWNSLVSLLKIITSFTKTKKDDQVLEKIDYIIEQVSSVSEEDVAKLKQVSKDTITSLKEIKEVLKK